MRRYDGEIAKLKESIDILKSLLQQAQVQTTLQKVTPSVIEQDHEKMLEDVLIVHDSLLKYNIGYI